jgi:hypothetical protein
MLQQSSFVVQPISALQDPAKKQAALRNITMQQYSQTQLAQHALKKPRAQTQEC